MITVHWALLAGGALAPIAVACFLNTPAGTLRPIEDLAGRLEDSSYRAARLLLICLGLALTLYGAVNTFACAQCLSAKQAS